MYAKYGSDAVPDQPRMGTEDLEELVVHIIRVRAVCDEARRLMKLADWSYSDERHYMLLMQVVFELCESGDYISGDIPYPALHSAACQTYAADVHLQRYNPHLITDIVGRPEDPEPHRGLLHFAYRVVDPIDLSVEYGINLLQRFLRERQVYDATRKLLDSATGRVVRDFGKVLTDMSVVEQSIAAIGSDPVRISIPEIWIPNPIKLTSTGIPWMDRFMGGQAARDINLLLGPFAGGKTTIAVQLAVERAKLIQALHHLGDPDFAGPLRKVIYVSYEEDVEIDIRPRVMSCAGRIDKKTMESLVSLDSLSRRGALKPYELAYYQSTNVTNPDEMVGEYERLMEARQLVGQNLYLFDMKNEGRGKGWVPELAAQIERAKDRYGWNQIDTIIIDYVKVMVRRHLLHQRMDVDRNLRHYINNTPFMLKTELAERFGCTVWALHQLSGEANKRSAAADLSHADSGEARDIAENAVNCMVLGVKDSQYGVSRVFYTKGRRSENSGKHTFIKTDGALGRTLDAESDFMVSAGKIVSKSLHHQIHGPESELAAPAVSTWDLPDEEED
jgi:hypothetical protein